MSTGFVEERLVGLHEALAGHVERGALPGLIALVARHGDVHVDVIGHKKFGDTDPLPRDAVFRIASLTKPIVATAAMMLVDDGVLRLDDRVDDLLPELANRQVLRALDSKLDETVPAHRSITVEDVLTYRIGYGCIMAPPGTYPIQVADDELDLRSNGAPWPPVSHTPDEWIAKLGTLPLVCQPGEQWMYNTSAQVLGVLVARASGRPIETLLRERIFDPLGMSDTGFTVRADQLHRLTTAYTPDPETGVLALLDDVDSSWWRTPPALPDAGGWLVSTIDDFWSFAQLLVNGGVRHGARLLSEAAVGAMTTDHLTAEQRAAAAFPFLDGHGWGFGMLAPAAHDDPPTLPGGYGWDGGTGTAWRSDRDAELTCILLTQRAMTSPVAPEVFTDFFEHAYGALRR